jgi:hypothetical protein
MARQTLGFSQSIDMHDLVIGLSINRYEVGHLAYSGGQLQELK